MRGARHARCTACAVCALAVCTFWLCLHVHTGCACPQVEGKLISAIQPGLLCYVGLGAGDTAKDADLMCVRACVRVRVHACPCTPAPQPLSRAAMHEHSAPFHNTRPHRCKKLLKARLWAGASSGKAWDEDVSAQRIRGLSCCTALAQTA